MKLLDFKETTELLNKYGISFPATVFASSKKEILSAGKRFPAYVKVYGKDILHRTEKLGVKEVASRQDLLKTFLAMQKIKGTEGVLFQEKIEGKSLIVGMKRDSQFGPVIMVGIGGIFTEIFKDFSLRVAPVSEKEAIKMIAELKGYDYLLGKRDKKPVNIKKVAKIVAAVSKLSLENGNIREIDLNPVIADKSRALAVDFKFLV